MNLRSKVKRWAYGSRVLYRGTFPYYGHKVHFPFGSHMFSRVCEEGIYEKETVRMIANLVRPSTTYIDIGANIGLLSLPILAERHDICVISIEASPDTLKYLERTHSQSEHKKRWKIKGGACGRSRENAVFYMSQPENGAFNGFKDTGRGGEKQAVVVEVRSLDEILEELGSPRVSVIKIDVEGAESDVIEGARNLIQRERPVVILEWSKLNLPAYGIEPEKLFNLCRDIGYKAYAPPALCEVTNLPILQAAMAQTEMFMLVPEETDNLPPCLNTNR